MKRTLTTTLSILAVLGLLATAVAQPGNWGSGPNRGQRADRAPMQRMTPPAGPAQGMGGGMGMQRGPEGVFGDDPEVQKAASQLRPFWKNDDLREAIKLTDEQVETLEKSFSDTRDALIDQTAELAHKRIALEEATQEEEPNLTTINKAIDALGAARTEIHKTIAAHRVLCKQTLTSDQETALRNFMEEKRQERREEFIANRRPGGDPEGDPDELLPGEGTGIRDRSRDRIHTPRDRNSAVRGMRGAN